MDPCGGLFNTVLYGNYTRAITNFTSDSSDSYFLD